jgi:hypothetical protein
MNSSDIGVGKAEVSAHTMSTDIGAYVDDFRYIALLCADCIPSAFLLKRASQSGGAE